MTLSVVANIAGGRYDKCLNNGGEYVEKWFEECRI